MLNELLINVYNIIQVIKQIKCSTLCYFAITIKIMQKIIFQNVDIYYFLNECLSIIKESPIIST